MQGTILVIDGVSTNRIMMKVQLAAAYYDVVLATQVSGVLEIARGCRPDLVLTANSLPDGSAADVKRELTRDDSLADVPVIAVSRTDNPMRRLEALSAGIDDVLPQPLDDVILQARIRSLLRTRSANEELNLQRDASHGFVLPLTDRSRAPHNIKATVALVAEDIQTARDWQDRLSHHVPHDIRTHQIGDIQPLMSDPVADVFIIELNEMSSGVGLRLLADLRARATTRQSVVIAVPNPADAHIAAEALDRGAHDVLQNGFNVEELALRLGTQLQYKHRHDLLRDSVRNGLRAAVEDPMTGLFNRRYAKPFLDRTARSATESGDKFALMLADLDHFKQINDRYGHPVGDAVLIEASRRLQSHLRPVDLLARVGGEEFMIVLPGANEQEASEAAVALCNAINSTPFDVPEIDEPIAVTISIGAVIGDGAEKEMTNVTSLIAKADQALYGAKNSGRNQVTLSRPDTAVA
ncbi:MAG: diguanylate cyclase [Pseudophaeobacter sp. bin_em_oilr2.035]|uniref:diguanylate cyclase n=1 Tax=Phaeobacter gallaeciensis TaxID=60890 RepID=A0ABD4XCJ7_9RHOB|nr:diguanylate cyclase [Phaeobacter gallaeciensis]MDF1772035.1 diguanylate cyclase [Pseudophaeobacter sp. bin_em_oilr2.035]MDE4146086.1 diguanylate cyclase [Phaeobacter gallaeciensis]MDE4158759.1 diguanylate cyclase [Phaeobacter gallaeciensis]MDE4162936.1 diguanylate cyclase [Phaeobacter gallaeciensis]MDE4167164.1 diguanylate cyclase [Phaeobacter gallaeciensis]